MGNCLNRCRKSKSAVAAADDDGHGHIADTKTEEKVAAVDDVEEGISGSGTEVKIKMTKRQMREMFAKVEQQGMQVGEVLAEWLEKRGAVEEGGNVSGGGGVGDSEMRRQQSWRPMLQSIPEIDQLK